MDKLYYKSPVGLLEIRASKSHITNLMVVDDKSTLGEDCDNAVLLQAKQQLDEYFAGKRHTFDLPLQQEGTVFQQKAWDYLTSIPYGETVSYKDEAMAVGSPKACRAIGSANGANNIAIIVPCHRVINADKKLGGYAYGLPMKEFLLKLEAEHAQHLLA